MLGRRASRAQKKLTYNSGKGMIRKKYNNWLLFDEEKNAIDYLEKSIFFLESVKLDPYNYKWIIISLFGALYGFAICAIKGTDSRSVNDKKRKGEYLISFDEAIKRCESMEYMRMTINSKPLILGDKERESINILKNKIRNEFEHFSPKSWAVSIELLEEIIPDIYRVIRFLALETGNYVLLDQEKYEYVKALLLRGKIA